MTERVEYRPGYAMKRYVAYAVAASASGVIQFAHAAAEVNTAWKLRKALNDHPVFVERENVHRILKAIR